MHVTIGCVFVLTTRLEMSTITKLSRRAAMLCSADCCCHYIDIYLPQYKIHSAGLEFQNDEMTAANETWDNNRWFI